MLNEMLSKELRELVLEENCELNQLAEELAGGCGGRNGCGGSLVCVGDK